MGVSGIQSPKQPQAFILPVNKTKAVKKVKNRVNKSNNQVVIFFCQPNNKANPRNTSSVIITIEKVKECSLNVFISLGKKPSLAHTSKNSCIL